MRTHHHGSKRQKLSLKYNIQKKVREHKRRVKKEAKKLGLAKRKRRDPGIPNSWPFKAQLLQEIERKKDQKEKELAERRLKAKEQSKQDQQRAEEEKRTAMRERELQRREKRAEEAERSQKEALLRVLAAADALIVALDARDPLGCRSSEFETWAQQHGKRVVFALTKTDLVNPQMVAGWLRTLRQFCPAVAVAAEAGREGVQELLQAVGHAPLPALPGVSTEGAVPQALAVGVVGYPGTGKKALCKALKMQAKGQTPWLQQTIGRLRPAGGIIAEDARAALQLALRSGLNDQTGDWDPIAVITQLFARCQPQALMRRFRLPAFDGIEGFLRAFCKDRDLKTSKGKEPQLPFIAKRVLTDLSVMPGCCCAPDEVTAASGSELWAAHGASRPALEALVQAQVASLGSRDAGPTAGSLVLASGGVGPSLIPGSLDKEKDGLDDDADLSEESGEDAEEDAGMGSSEEELEEEEGTDDEMDGDE